jgi:hypothetical protein
MKNAAECSPHGAVHGRLSNQPVVVADNLEAIVKALGIEAGVAKLEAALS